MGTEVLAFIAVAAMVFLAIVAIAIKVRLSRKLRRLQDEVDRLEDEKQSNRPMVSMKIIDKEANGSGRKRH